MQYVVAKAEAVRSRSASVAMIGKLLVTGGTGFIGGAVLAELLTTSLWPKTLILARGNDTKSALERIVQSLQRFHPDLPVSALVDERQIVVGALDDRTALATDERIADITHVIHAAAVTSFSASPKIRAINVDASLAFVQLLTERASVKRFLNVGTAWCVGQALCPLRTIQSWADTLCLIRSQKLNLSEPSGQLFLIWSLCRHDHRLWLATQRSARLRPAASTGCSAQAS
jgi:nucleoside-diphosphate-sugar epimerase